MIHSPTHDVLILLLGFFSHSLGQVWRHLRSGDVMLVNRQPTLHKASIMAHQARVLKKDDVVRMHYANCNSYNADFDGDEINLHFPQTELGRAEAYHVANTANQYVGAGDGEPLRGLIQDFVDMGVVLTKPGTFLTRDQYQQLLFAGLFDVHGGGEGRVASVVREVPVARDGAAPSAGYDFTLEEPAIQKPEQLWTGKQVITNVLNILLRDAAKLTMAGHCKVKDSDWGVQRKLPKVSKRCLAASFLSFSICTTRRIPHSAFHIPHSAFCFLHSARLDDIAWLRGAFRLRSPLFGRSVQP
jgi:DNA-directed RNA polymerase I subunit RPA1